MTRARDEADFLNNYRVGSKNKVLNSDFFIWQRGSNQTATITGAVAGTNSVTYTASNSFVVGQYVYVSGVSPTSLNTGGQVTAASSTSFTITGSGSGTFVTGGTASGCNISVPSATPTLTADRWGWYSGGSGATINITQQMFTPGTAPVAGYEGTYYLQMAQTIAGTGSTLNELYHRIEDVRTFAGQAVTVSFWAKSSNNNTTVTPAFEQWFTNSGSAATNTNGTPITITTSWARYSQTIYLPSLTGATILPQSSFLQLDLIVPSNTVQTISFWGIQAESGSVATTFSTATGTQAAELASCLRYYWRKYTNLQAGYPVNSYYGYTNFGLGQAWSTTQASIFVNYPVPMRVTPSFNSSAASTFILTTSTNGASSNMTGLSVDIIDSYSCDLFATVGAANLTAGNAVRMVQNAYSLAWIEFNAEF
jgi:hypothetical protein